jgi:hypothetical protein
MTRIRADSVLEAEPLSPDIHGRFDLLGGVEIPAR